MTRDKTYKGIKVEEVLSLTLSKRSPKLTLSICIITNGAMKTLAECSSS